MKEKLKYILKDLNKGLIEREEHIKLVLLSLLANENIILIGPPGTAKSEISRRLSEVIEDSSYFEYLLTKFTTPEEVFGPISIKELENDRFHRNIEGYVTDSNIVFLDEVFKANSSILNSLLTIMNERIYHNGSKREETEIKSIIGASNELPLGESELEALYDRFLIKKKVDYVKDTKKLFYLDKEVCRVEDKLSLEDLDKITKESENVLLPDSIADKILKIKEEIEGTLGTSESISDRKLVKGINLLKVAAYTSNRSQISIFDLLLLQHVFWTNPENSEEVSKIIVKEIMDISNFEKSNLKEIFVKWQEHFNKLYEEQKKDRDGDLLYLNENGEATKEKRGEIHLRDNMGNYIFFKGHRDHVKILAELGKFDHGYIDTGIKTIDKKIVWKYEFSPIKIKTNHTKDLDEFTPLTVNGLLEPFMIKSFKEYYLHYNRKKHELKEILNEIKRNLESEIVLVEDIYNKLLRRQSHLKNESIEALWVSNNQLANIEELVDNKVLENKTLLEAYTNLIIEIKEAM